MQKYKDEIIPSRYAVCQFTDCPMAKSCLRQIAYQLLLDNEDENCLLLLKPRFCSKDGNCSYYRDCNPVLFAKGFTNFQKKMYPSQYQLFMMRLKGKFGRNSYFMRRRGESLLSPEEQKFILDTLKQVGVTEDMTFDAYVEKIYW
ncbi:MAG: DUF6078 family protein [Prevotellaceae bacterium]|nr:DUF6078 family protein [Prevotellaceae bacterium]